MIHFNKITDYFNFVGAKEFAYHNNTPFRYTKNICERIGDFVVAPVLKPFDFSLRNIRNPLFIVALTVGCLFLATLLFYPGVVAAVIVGAPLIKLAAYVLVQTTLVGLCLRTLGRLANPELTENWNSLKIQPLSLGTELV